MARRTLYAAGLLAAAMAAHASVQPREITKVWVDELEPPTSPKPVRHPRKIKPKGGPKRKAKHRSPRPSKG